MRVYELLAELRYSIRVKAESRKDALAHVESWGDAWPQSAEFIGVADISIVLEDEDFDNCDEEAAIRAAKGE
jgi:hypothetical protein